MNKYHQQILKLIKDKSDNNFKSKHDLKTYCGTDDPCYDLSNPQMRKIAKQWIKTNRQLEQQRFVAMLDSLYRGKTDTEKRIAGMLLEYLPKLRKKINPLKLNQWLNSLQGWAQIDSLCQSSFTAQELLKDWAKWKKLLVRLNKENNLNKKRASLVLLVKSVRGSENKKLRNFAFQQIERLKEEDHKLITKAISWLLREMIKKHRFQVIKYLKENKDSLPAVAVRETKRKLETGRK